MPVQRNSEAVGHYTGWELRQYVGMKLLAIRESTGLTQSEFAEKIGTIGQMISSWETGHRMPTIFNLMRYADVAEVDWNEFFDLK